MKTIGRDFGDVARKVYATASGTLPNGKPVVVNADGTVSVISSTAQELGSEVVFNDSNSFYICSAFDPDNSKIVLAYRDTRSGASNGKAIVGTISGTSVSFGTPVVFKASAAISYASICYDTNSNKFVIAYTDAANNNYGTAVVGTVSGTNISFGTTVVFESANSSHQSAVFDSSNNKVAIAYSDIGNSSYGTAIVGTVSGTNISFGTATVFESANSSYICATFDSSSNKIVISYRDAGNSQFGTAIVGTISGTNISFGTAAAYTSVATFAHNECLYNSDSNNVLITADLSESPYYTAAVVGTVSGTSISFGSSVYFPNSISASNSAEVIGIGYDSDLKQYACLTNEYFNSASRGSVQLITISGTTPVMGDVIVFSSERIANNDDAITYDTTANKFLIGFADLPNSYKGTSIVLKGSSANLTAENYIGMSSGGVEYDEGPATIGSAVVFENATVPAKSSTFDSNSNKVVIVYRDGGNSNYGTAVVGTVNGTSISFGSVVVFESAAVNYVSCTFDSNSNKVVISYTDDGNSGYGTAIVGTVSGTNISFGTAVVFRSAGAGSTNATFDSNSNKVVICYAGDSDHGTAIVGTVSGTGISFGTAVVYESANSVLSVATFDSNSNKVVIAYNDYPNGQYGTAIVGTVSGTNISFGTAVVFENASIGTTGHTITFDSNSNKVVIAYQDIGNSSYGTAIVGTVSGTGISFGTAVVFENATSTYPAATFDSNSNKVVIAYRDGGNSNKGTVIAGAVSGTSISFESPTVFESGASLWITTVFDSNSNTSVISYRDDGNSGYGTSIVFKNAFDNTVRGQVASGGAALVNTKGAININQNALTAGQSYFVQPDGTIGTTAGTPSVFAGTAVSATKLIVKG